MKRYENTLISGEKPSNKVKDHMKTRYISVDENTNMLEVLNIMTERNFRNIAVKNSEEEVVGLITPTNLLSLISEISPDTGKEVVDVE